MRIGRGESEVVDRLHESSHRVGITDPSRRLPGTLHRTHLYQQPAGCAMIVELVTMFTNREVSMIGVIVTIGPSSDLDRERANSVAAAATPMFDGMDGLRSKVFMWDEASQTVTNTYVWESEDAARAFFTPEMAVKITEFYGAAPQVRLLEVSALIENAVGVA
jgi:hypothetical protein